MSPVKRLFSIRSASVILLLLIPILHEQPSYGRNIDIFQSPDSPLSSGRSSVKRVVNYNWVKRADEPDPQLAEPQPQDGQQPQDPTQPEQPGAEPEPQSDAVDPTQSAPNEAEPAPAELPSGDLEQAAGQAPASEAEPNTSQSTDSAGTEASEPKQEEAQAANEAQQEAQPSELRQGEPQQDGPRQQEEQAADQKPEEVQQATPSEPVLGANPSPEPQEADGKEASFDASPSAPAEGSAVKEAEPSEEVTTENPTSATQTNPPSAEAPTQAMDPKPLETPAIEKAAAPVVAQVISNVVPSVPSGTNQSLESYESPQVERWSYRMDKESCNPLAERVPIPILKMTVEKIFDRLSNQNCSDKLDLKLRPMANKQISGHVMEVSSMPLEVQQLVVARDTLVKCSSSQETVAEGKLRKFELIFVQEFDDQKLRSKWRHYPQLQLDDIPLSPSTFKLMSSPKSGPKQQMKPIEKASSKCQSFKLEGGDFYLEMLSLKTELTFSVQLKHLGDTNYGASDKFGGQIRAKELELKELYLDHFLMMSPRDYQQGLSSNVGSSSRTINESRATAQPTVQVLHEHNNHYHRNNWLLNVYGNWLKQEYREQLSTLFPSGRLTSQLNRCLIDN